MLSYVFFLPVAVLGLAAAVYSPGYLRGHGDGRPVLYCTFYALMLLSMTAVAFLKVPLAFLVAWEIMGLSSAVLVGFDSGSRSTPRALWIYLAACQGGAAFLMLMFAGQAASALAPVCVFAFGMLGFGLKAGFPGLHVWLPEAHPAAPAPVSAVMSGAMINLGLYGALVFSVVSPDLTFVYGMTFLLLGIAGSVGGILFALGQTNLKTLLAFSSIENMGIISTGIGLGFLGIASGNGMMTVCGFSGALFHVINHAFLKGGLFLCAGSVYKSVHTLEMEKTGGLMKKMPVTGSLFILNALGICGLPPFNGFIGEFIIYAAAFAGIVNGRGVTMFASIAAATSLALTGGLAVAAFAKAIGAVFLGMPRTEIVSKANEVPKSMFIPVCVLFGFSFSMVVFAPAVFRILAYCASEIAGPLAVSSRTALEFQSAVALMTRPLNAVVAASAGTVVLTALLLVIRRFACKRGDIVKTGPTWDCGYAAPSARMEYTGTAFSQPLVDFFAFVLRPVRGAQRALRLFPCQGDSASDIQVRDAGIRALWAPVFTFFADLSERLHVLQSGYLHLYILSMVAAIFAMLLYAFCF